MLGPLADLTLLSHLLVGLDIFTVLRPCVYKAAVEILRDPR